MSYDSPIVPKRRPDVRLVRASLAKTVSMIGEPASAERDDRGARVDRRRTAQRDGLEPVERGAAGQRAVEGVERAVEQEADVDIRLLAAAADRAALGAAGAPVVLEVVVGHADARAPGALRRVLRRVGRAQQIAGRAGRPSPTEATPHETLSTGPGARRKLGEHGLAGDPGLVGAAPGQQDAELVAADARHQRIAVVADDGRQGGGDPRQRAVAELVPVGVVELLEVVDVAEEHGQVAALPRRGP